MEMIKNITQTDSGIEGEVFWSLFDQYIELLAFDVFDLAYVEKHAQYLNALSEKAIDDLCQASIRYCNDFLKMIGEQERTFDRPRDVLDLVYPAVLIVPTPGKEESIIHMELNCDWEEEHGMEWLIRNNQVLYVGAFNGMAPWADYTIKQQWNYA